MTIADAPFDLTGRRALVTGAAGHLGAAISAALAGAGAHVWLAGRSEEPLGRLADALDTSAGRATPLVLDVTDAHSIARASDRLAEEAGTLDVLVSNAHAARSQAYDSVRSADFARAAGLAAGAAHELLLSLLPLLRRTRDERPSSAILVGSMYGTVSPDPRLYPDAASQNPADYGAAKAGLIQYARHAAVHLAAEGVRVNSLSPGPFPRTEGADPAFLADLAGRVPLGRVGTPEELATAVLFLAAPASSFVTGIDLRVDGGWTAW